MIDGGADQDLQPRFEFGTHKDLLRFLNDEARLESYPYPLIYMETPVRHRGNFEIVSGEIILILATKTRPEFSNRERLDKTIRQRLQPLFANVITALNESSMTRIIKEGNNELRTSDYEVFYNYGNEQGTKQKVTDIWDAIKVKMKIEVNNNCLLPITY